MLKGVKPEIVKPGKPKILLSGRSGVGKSIFSLDFPAPYYMDIEGGATRPQYQKKLLETGAIYFGKDQGSQDFQEIIAQTKALATTKHDRKSVVFDSFTKIYNLEAAIAEAAVGNDFGRDKKEANRPTRQLIRWLDKLDMAVILICHQRDKWERKGGQLVCTGTTFEGYDKLEYEFDLWLEIQKDGKNRSFVVKKSRVEAFIEGNEYPLEFKVFAEMYGKEILDKESVPVEMASAETVSEIERLIAVMKTAPEEVQAWKNKADVDSFSEMPKDKATKLLDLLNKRLQGAK